MMDYITQNLWLVWLLASVLCLILELSSGTFYLLCLAFGAIISMIASLIGLGIVLQILVFAIASVLSIFLIRPVLVKRISHKGSTRTSNADALIGRVGMVIEEIKPGNAGYVKVDGDEWKAVTTLSGSMPVGTKVKIVKMDSIIVTVVPLNE